MCFVTAAPRHDLNVITRGRATRHFLLTAAVGLLVLAGCTSSSGSGTTSANTARSPGAAPTGSTQSVLPSSTGSGAMIGFNQIPGIVRAVQPSVVTITIPHTDLGSGVVYKSDGYIITNNHVVCPNGQCASTVSVQFADGKTVAGTVVARDQLTDLAVVKAARTGLPAASFSTPLPPVGSLAVAIGSPLGFQESVTAGIISGTHRDIPSSITGGNPALVDLIQTDAAISPGNSGGALVDAQGTVVGINDAYIPPQQGAVSLGFAIPAATATKIADELIATGRAAHPYIGVGVQDLTPQIANALGVGRDTGAVVKTIDPGSPAAQAGLAPGDVIISIAGHDVQTAQDITVTLRDHKAGEKISLSYVRGGGTKQVMLTLAERPAQLG